MRCLDLTPAAAPPPPHPPPNRLTRRIRAHGASAAAAHARIAARNSALLCEYAALVCVNPLPLHHATLVNIETLTVSDDPPSAERWQVVVEEMGMSPLQESQLRILLEMWHRTVDPWLAEREALMARQQVAPAAAGDDTEEIVERLEWYMLEFVWKSATCMLSLYGGVLRPEQVRGWGHVRLPAMSWGKQKAPKSLNVTLPALVYC